MGKLRQWFIRWFDNQLEKAFQRTADRINKETQEGNNDTI